jgi:hypothetical protein
MAGTNVMCNDGRRRFEVGQDALRPGPAFPAPAPPGISRYRNKSSCVVRAGYSALVTMQTVMAEKREPVGESS